MPARAVVERAVADARHAARVAVVPGREITLSVRPMSRNRPLAWMTRVMARRRLNEPRSLNGNGRRIMIGSTRSSRIRTVRMSPVVGESTSASRWSALIATEIDEIASRPSPSIIVSAIAIIVWNWRSDKKRGLKRARSDRRRRPRTSNAAATSTTPITIGTARPSTIPHTSHASPARASARCRCRARRRSGAHRRRRASATAQRRRQSRPAGPQRHRPRAAASRARSPTR